MKLKTSDKPRLIYVLGWGRSGSSILANILGSLEGGASCGEIRYIWDRGVADNTICGCGQTFSDCDFWPDVRFGETRFGDMDHSEATRLARSIGSGGRPAQALALMKAPKYDAYLDKNGTDLRASIAMYEDIFAKSGARVVVDSSKSPFFAVNLLTQERSFDVFFLHLVRDPRAVLYSWRKAKKREEGGSAEDFPQYSALRSLLQWRFVNAACERFATRAPGSYALMRYEDFVEDWQGQLIAAAPDIFEDADGTNPHVHAQHSISGNPSRFNFGEITLKRDRGWEGNLTTLDNALIKALVARAARSYGYKI